MNEVPVLKQLGLKIREIRLSKDIKQNDLARECDFEKASMSRIESGRSNITVRSLYKISKALEVEINELFKD
jgi:transcriptional regulator with XRE-family HTH domain